MQIVDRTLEGAIDRAIKETNCSIRELEYEIIQLPKAGFLGFFKKDAIIEVKVKKKIEINIIEDIAKDLKNLFCSEYFDVRDVVVTPANENSVNVEFIANSYESLIGKDAHKYKALDTIVNHLINIKYNLHARVEICGVLAKLRENLEKHLSEVKTKIDEVGKAQTRPLETSLLNLVYEELLKEFSHKNIVIKDSSLGRYIAIYGEFKKQ
ncbi:Jag N-terminal domain-containing protein [Campylobacter sp. RM12642]|uniref:Jag N-terminal domain-containing protein n=1 Tax=unclassified Campylobacter TaxID=2593542 RepID=UPI001D6CE703|nr:Jag N-terminal domain-containing protein [Campylobacter sp. RM12642]MBZ8008421.1 Jag N-terminal domain-containing protein [Campylobacter sp. RM9334]